MDVKVKNTSKLAVFPRSNPVKPIHFVQSFILMKEKFSRLALPPPLLFMFL
jgi:hypothetical protein